jgi:hypothetical protein
MPAFELAELNFALMKAPMESPIMAEFVANLERMNALADRSPGFIWRLQTDEGDATGLRPMGETTLINISVWRDVESLRDYVYRTAHSTFVGRRQEWFEHTPSATLVLWWVPAGHRPTNEEALTKLQTLRDKGPTIDAFTFRESFAPPPP